MKIIVGNSTHVTDFSLPVVGLYIGNMESWETDEQLSILKTVSLLLLVVQERLSGRSPKKLSF